jgi:hypothetical protein
MPVSKDQVIREVAKKVGPSITVDAKLERGMWRVTLSKEGKASVFDFKRGFMEDYFNKGEYQQEMAFEGRINKALRELK